MIVGDAKDAARQWAIAEAGRTPGFAGAFLHGSVAWLPDDAPLAATSDVDVMVVRDDPDPSPKLGKLVHRGVLLDVTYLPADQLPSPEAVLGQYHLAGSFRTPSIIVDPSGRLTRLQAAVAKDFAKRRWVLRRCEHARTKVLGHLHRLNEAEPFHDQVVPWLFGTGVTTHVLLTAGLANPTVRRRYLAARALLEDYGHAEFYDDLLGLLGCARMDRPRVEHHLTALTAAFDAAKAVIKTPFFFASDISDAARPIAIDGSRELIARGDHREAVFWMVATYSRCQKVFGHDAPAEVGERFGVGYRRLLGDLGIGSFVDLRRRGEAVVGFLPRVWEVTEEIIVANPEIDD